MASKKSETTESLRSTLFETIGLLHRGAIQVQDAKAISDVAKRIIDTAELELKYAAAAQAIDGFDPKPLQLTSPETSADDESEVDEDEDEPEPAKSIAPLKVKRVEGSRY